MADLHTNVFIDFDATKNNKRYSKYKNKKSTTKQTTQSGSLQQKTGSIWGQSKPNIPTIYTNTHPKTNNQVGKIKETNQQKRKSHTNDFKIEKNEEPVKIGSLLGLEQVGQCIFIEYKDDIILIDAGMEFASGDSTMGVDYIIPDVAYIKKNIEKLKGIFLTHGHLDHIGALKDILPELNRPTIYTTPLTLGIVKKTFEDSKKITKLKYKIVDPETEIVKVGVFAVEFARVNHNIPETFALAIHTPKGIIFTSGDFKIDYTPAIDKPADLAKIARIGAEGVKLYIGDSLNSQKQGYVPSEKIIGKNLEEIIRTAEGRLIIATFATNVGRIIQIIKSAIKYDKIVFLSGRSIVNNVEICQELGYINVPKSQVRKLDQSADDMPDHKIVILCTGAQGEEFSALARMARDDHQQIKLRKGDTILLSSSVIPGNELATQTMKNNLINKGVNVITNDDMDVHASGHGGAEDHKMMLHLLKPEYFLPFYMDAFSRNTHKKLALDMGYPEDHIFMPDVNGSIIELYNNGARISNEKIKLNTVVIDGKGMGHLSGEYVIKARKIMADDGVIAFIIKADAKTKELVGNIQIESRGFVYSSEVKKIHTDIVEFIRKKYESYGQVRDIKRVLRKIKEDLSAYILKLIGREPLIIPMFVYINREGKHEDISEEVAVIGMTIDEQGEDGKLGEEKYIQEQKEENNET